ncbi:MAG: DUF3160 domain-containing protein, partial [Planctomycetota bacterium]
AMFVVMAYGIKPKENAGPGALFHEVAKNLPKAIERLEKGDLPEGRAAKKWLGEIRVDLRPLWRRLQTVCLKLEALAHKQLRGTALSDRDKAFIKGYGEAIAGIMLYGGNAYLTPKDDAPRIVDVFSNPEAGRVLEVGVGRPRALYVLYPVKGGDILCQGAVMPYYEFQNSARLADMEW